MGGRNKMADHFFRPKRVAPQGAGGKNKRGGKRETTASPIKDYAIGMGTRATSGKIQIRA